MGQAELKTALGDDGDPPLYSFVKLIALRGHAEIEGWKQWKGLL